MVLPVTGPFIVNWTSQNYYKNQSVYKQARPFDRPLTYSMTCCRLMVNTLNEAASGIKLSATQVGSFPETNWARMKAYERLKDKIGSRASMGENFVDLDQSVKTIVKRSTQLFEFTREIKRGNFRTAANILRTPEPRTRHPIKEQANNWLEYHLGIEPVIKDIFTAIDILQKPIDNVFVKASARQPKGSWGYDYPPPYWYSYRYTDVMIVCRYQAEVAISNPVLYLANAMGILNPVQVVWQTIPLSFVVDWFANVEQFFGTSTDFWGLTTKNTFSTLFWSGNYHQNEYSGRKSSGYLYGLSRDLGLTLPSLSLRPYKATSWQRGLTAISLLVGGLKSLDKTNYKPEKRKLKFVKFDPNLQGRMQPGHSWNWYEKYL